MDAICRTEQEEQSSHHLYAVSGIEGVRVSVSQVEAAAAEFGMSAPDLTLFVHGMLRLAGVPVVLRHDDSIDAPTFHTTVTVGRIIDLYSVSLSVELWDRVWLARQTHVHAIQAATWRRSAWLVSNRHELRQNTRMELGNLLTSFLNDYTAANHAPVSRAVG